ncbi:MAG: hypothetical protein KDD34_05075 [Bdellovibrionales bacterium]|nr:hypothetical protein [Bdellovibrionales bacterium]
MTQRILVRFYRYLDLGSLTYINHTEINDSARTQSLPSGTFNCGQFGRADSPASSKNVTASNFWAKSQLLKGTFMNLFKSTFFAFLFVFSQARADLKPFSSDPSVDKIAPQLVAHGYNDLFELVRFFSSNKSVVKFIKSSLPELLILSDSSKMQLGIDGDLKTIPEHLFLQVFRSDVSVYNTAFEIFKQAQKARNPEEELQVLSKYADKFQQKITPKLLLAQSALSGEAQLKPLELYNPNINDHGGIRGVFMFANTPRIVNGQLLPANNLIETVTDFIRSAKKEIVLNIFDFDIEEIADALIEAANRGVQIRVGMDAGVIEARPEVKAIYEKLKTSLPERRGHKVHAVDSVSLNHQKLIASDWTLPGKGRVLTSSGNLTHSGLNLHGDTSDTTLMKTLLEAEKELQLQIPQNLRTELFRITQDFRKQKGDGVYSEPERQAFFKKIELVAAKINNGPETLKALKPTLEKLMDYSVPNANHMVIYHSDSFAQLVNHELSKTIDLEMKGKAGDNPYPYSSIYKICRTNGTGCIFVSFSPNGGYGEINLLLANLIHHIPGNINMLQFAFSSKEVYEALLEAIYEDNREFRSVGEAPFALSYWSVFLKLAGIKRPSPQQKENSGVEDFYYIDENFSHLDHPQYKNIVEKIRVAPQIYGNRAVKIANTSLGITSKLHHKIITIGDLVSTPGTSHNFSEGALSNQEQIIVAVDKELTSFINSIFEYIYAQTNEKDGILNVTIERNARQKVNPTAPMSKKEPLPIWPKELDTLDAEDCEALLNL